jgi:molybdate transport system substrate-binding protein
MQSLHDFMPLNSNPLSTLRALTLTPGRRASLRGLLAMGCTTALPWAWGQGSQSGEQAPVRVLAASDLKFALARVVKPFELETGIKVELNFGSSGNFARQIVQGLPADIFMSADEDWAARVEGTGLAKGPGVIYAQGRLALLVPKNSAIALDTELKGLQVAWASVRKFAIANPEHAPYGRAAQQALTSLKLWTTVQPKLVLGENIAQASLFVTSGAAQAGISALALATAPELTAISQHIALPEHLHAPLRQRMLLLKSASPAAAQLYNYLQSPATKAQLKLAGFG